MSHSRRPRRPTLPALAIGALLLAAAPPVVAGDDSRHIEINGARLFVRTIGSGPAVVLVHGGPGFNHRYFLPHMERLAADGFSLVLFDLRGHGRSLDGVSAESLSFDAFVEDLEELRAALGLDKIHLMAHSWGTLVAMEYAIRHSDHLESLALVSPLAAKRGEFDEETRARQHTQIDEAGSDRMGELMASEGFEARDPEVVAEFFEAMWRASFFDRDALARLDLDLGDRYAESSRLLEALYRDEKLADYDFHPRLSAVSVPTLVVYGDHDTIPKAAAEKIVSALPRGHGVLLGECGHFPFVDCPQPFFDALRRFYSDPEAER